MDFLMLLAGINIALLVTVDIIMITFSPQP
jgi:hypothetical protein